MITICIPVYNFDVRELVNTLVKQAREINAGIEIIVIDDASAENIKQHNRPLDNLPEVSVIELNHNIGRSRIRNRFLQYAHTNYLLFLDCDSRILHSGFLRNYFAMATKFNYSVICGGTQFPKTPVKLNKRLRWKYAVTKEIKSAEERTQHPHRSFITRNFLIRKDIFTRINFDPRITGYGHEDTLFGYHLKQDNIPVVHIDNPVLPEDIDTNIVFLQKTEQAIDNLHYIYTSLNYDEAFAEKVALLRFYKKTKQLKLTNLIKISYIILRPPLKLLLRHGICINPLFAFYKLGYWIRHRY